MLQQSVSLPQYVFSYKGYEGNGNWLPAVFPRVRDMREFESSFPLCLLIDWNALNDERGIIVK